jgi:hypothetical protein
MTAPYLPAPGCRWFYHSWEINKSSEIKKFRHGAWGKVLKIQGSGFYNLSIPESLNPSIPKSLNPIIDNYSV